MFDIPAGEIRRSGCRLRAGLKSNSLKAENVIQSVGESPSSFGSIVAGVTVKALRNDSSQLWEGDNEYEAVTAV
jgi:hypothetical protein